MSGLKCDGCLHILGTINSAMTIPQAENLAAQQDLKPWQASTAQPLSSRTLPSRSFGTYSGRRWRRSASCWHHQRRLRLWHHPGRPHPWALQDSKRALHSYGTEAPGQQSFIQRS